MYAQIFAMGNALFNNQDPKLYGSIVTKGELQNGGQDFLIKYRPATESLITPFFGGGGGANTGRLTALYYNEE